jgi:hypothetical protein
MELLLINGHASYLQAATLPRGMNTRGTGTAEEGKKGETKMAVLVAALSLLIWCNKPVSILQVS